MATPDFDARVASLYQLPLHEFTSARNALAKELGRAEIKKLEKPNVAAWGVNQLYWKQRATYSAVIASAEQLRAEHRKLLSGKPSAIRDVEKAHRDTVRRATGAVEIILQEGGHSTTDATLTAVRETLEALPSDEPPGRLTRPLKPTGFEALAGMAPQAAGFRRDASAAKSQTSPPLALVKSAKDAKRQRDEAKRREKEERERQERQRQAEKELKAAETAMLRAEDAVKKAEKTLADLRAMRDEAVNAYQRARLRARE